MSVILPQYLAAILLYLKDKNRFAISRSSEEIRNPETTANGDGRTGPALSTGSDIQEAILTLSGTKHLGNLDSTVREALALLLPSVTDCVVYIRKEQCGDLISSDRLVHSLPTTGLAYDAFSKRQVIFAKQGLDESDPLCGLLPTGVNPLNNGKTVVCCPVISKEDNTVVAVLAVVCNPFSLEVEKSLLFILQLIAATYQSLKLTNMTESRTEAILELCGDLHDQDAATLQLKVIKYLEKHTSSETAFLLLVSPCASELFCQVIGNNVLQEEMRFTACNNNCFSSALSNKRPVDLQDIPPEHLKELEKIVGVDVRSFLCVPVTRQSTGDVVALACMVNKHGADQSYTKVDIETIQHCFKYTSTVLTSTLAFQNERKLKNQTEALLQVAKNLFTHLDDLTNLLREIMQEARNLTHAERCSVFLLDDETDELVAKVFDGSITNDSLESELRIPSTQGIAGHVVTTGEILNIHDAYSHPLFYRGVDDATGFKTRNILCFPIKDEKENTVGVAQLCNKIDGKNFTTFDEDIARAFSIYCCISIVHSLLYKNVQGAQYRSRLATELMIYHMQVNQEDVETLTKCHVPPPRSFDPLMDHFLFTPRGIPEMQTTLAIVSMMDEMGFLNRYRMRRDTVARFLLMVRKGYRDPPYHNWMHAFSVAHFCYLLDRNLGLNKYLREVEVLALFVACLCHDIDHRGTNNTFQVTSQSVLAALYSSEGSVMERHHFAQTMCILNTEGCNIFENLRRKEYEQVLDLMRDIILATDIAHHLRIFKDLQALVSNDYDKNNPKCRDLLLSLLMTSSDLCDQTKPWRNATKIAEMIYQEFFSQGDLEKALGRNPSEMMDRDRACIPNLQIEFLDKIATPVYQLLADMFPKASDVVHAVRNNRSKWFDVNEKLKKRKLSVSASLDIFNALAEEENPNGAHNGETSEKS